MIWIKFNEDKIFKKFIKHHNQCFKNIIKPFIGKEIL
jgi:hypothetical protein